MFRRWIIHRFKSGHRAGRGIHAPFAYRFVREAVYGTDPEGLSRLETIRAQWLKNPEIIQVQEAGAGSRRMRNRERSIASIARYTAITPSRGRLLARIVAMCRPAEILELGTGLGLSSMYMGIAHPDTHIQTCEADPSIAGLARAEIQKAGLDNIRVHTAVFEPWLETVLNQNRDVLFVHIDGDHRGVQLERYTLRIMQQRVPLQVIVLDDIHWSSDMYAAWTRIRKRSGNRISFECWNVGILICRPGLQRDHYVLKFF